MSGSYRAELLKLVRWPAMWILAAVLLVLSQVFGYLIPYVGYRSGGGSGFAAGQTPAQLVAASEYGWGTLKTILTQRPRRRVLLAGKLLSVATAILVLVVAVFAMDSLWSWLIAATEGRPADWPSLLELGRGIGAGWLILGMWSLVGALLGILFRSTSLAVGLGLVWALAVENLIRGFAGLLGFLDAFQRGLPGVNAGSLVASLGAATLDQPGGTPGVTAVVSGPQALLVLSAYVVVLTVAAGVTLHRQDVQ